MQPVPPPSFGEGVPVKLSARRSGNRVSVEGGRSREVERCRSEVSRGTADPCLEERRLKRAEGSIVICKDDLDLVVVCRCARYQSKSQIFCDYGADQNAGIF